MDILLSHFQCGSIGHTVYVRGSRKSRRRTIDHEITPIGCLCISAPPPFGSYKSGSTAWGSTPAMWTAYGDRRRKRQCEISSRTYGLEPTGMLTLRTMQALGIPGFELPINRIQRRKSISIVMPIPSGGNILRKEQKEMKRIAIIRHPFSLPDLFLPALPGAARIQGSAAALNPGQQIITQERSAGQGAVLTISPAQVRLIQQALNQMGYDTGNVDGQWGQQTSQALLNFQQSVGLEPTGQINTRSLQALGCGQHAGWRRSAAAVLRAVPSVRAAGLPGPAGIPGATGLPAAAPAVPAAASAVPAAASTLHSSRSSFRGSRECRDNKECRGSNSSEIKKISRNKVSIEKKEPPEIQL